MDARIDKHLATILDAAVEIISNARHREVSELNAWRIHHSVRQIRRYQSYIDRNKSSNEKPIMSTKEKAEMLTQLRNLRMYLKNRAADTLQLKFAVGCPVTFEEAEVPANIMLAYRHLEDAAMRLGKAIQAIDGGVSCYNDNKPSPSPCPSAEDMMRSARAARRVADHAVMCHDNQPAPFATPKAETHAERIIRTDRQVRDLMQAIESEAQDAQRINTIAQANAEINAVQRAQGLPLNCSISPALPNNRDSRFSDRVSPTNDLPATQD